ncbi:MAG: glycoside hydrolase family 28 protein [Eubacteriales bacterium]|nr:glycoside hydrolase family 28 protein [Eubacteriales bacterium]
MNGMKEYVNRQREIKIETLETDTTITAYWEKPENFKEGQKYLLSADGRTAAETDKTHYTFYDLEPDKDYRIMVRRMEENICCECAAVTVRTKKTKRKLDITGAPYFAAGDGKTMNTAAIQQAIDQCSEETFVYIPAGVFLTGSLRLHSNMELYLEEGAVLQGTANREDYLPKIPSRFEGIERSCYSSLLNLGDMDHAGSCNCCNVVIRGKGTIASGGKKLAENIISYEREDMKREIQALGDKIQEYEKEETIPGRLRPRLINISNCRNVSISGLTLKDGASWNVHMIYSDRIVTDHCTFFSKDVWNGDGWDPDSSTNCTIFACTFHTGDDAISIKSGKNPEGNRIGRPSRNIRIFDCHCVCGHGITIGSEISGGVEDVSIWDCDMTQSRCGIEIKATKKRGGYVRNVVVRDCSASRILLHSVDYNDDGEGAETMPFFENCRFQNVHVTGQHIKDQKEIIPCNALELCGFDHEGHSLRNITFENIRLQ